MYRYLSHAALSRYGVAVRAAWLYVDFMSTHDSVERSRIAVVGSYGTGMTMWLDRVPDRGETLGGARFSAGPGGKGSNQAIGAARLGAQVRLLTAVGDDEFGAAARRLWREEGVDASGVVTVDAATMVGVILVEPDGENRIVIAPGALDLVTPEHVGGFAEAIAGSDLLMVCNEIPADVVVAALRLAQDHGVATLYNPAPARDLPAEARGLVDYLTPNFGEARVLAGLDSADSAGQSVQADEILDRLRERFDATIVLTAGGDGAYVDDPAAGRSHVPPVTPPEIVDTTGAGDAFNAALAVALCRGDDPVTATRYAVAAGAFAVSRPEVIPGLATPDDLAALLAENSPPDPAGAAVFPGRDRPDPI
jgi:ribokinase